MQFNGQSVKFCGIAHADVGGHDVIVQTIEPSVAGVVSIIPVKCVTQVVDGRTQYVIWVGKKRIVGLNSQPRWFAIRGGSDSGWPLILEASGMYPEPFATGFNLQGA